MSESDSEQGVEFADIEAELTVDVPTTEDVVGQETKTEEFKVPEKFSGKSLEDVVKSYTELEREFGRRNNEVGELRKLTDQLLGLQLADKEQKATKDTREERPSVDFDSLVENPNEAVGRIIESNPKLRQLEEKLILKERQEALKGFETKHSDWKDLVASQDFQEWVGASAARKRLFAMADSNYDYELADELFSTYKESKGKAMSESKEQAEAKREADLKSASTEKGTSGQKASKVYSRAQLINLRVRDPEKYQQLLPEIERAYAEGRVR